MWGKLVSYKVTLEYYHSTLEGGGLLWLDSALAVVGGRQKRTSLVLVKGSLRGPLCIKLVRNFR